MKYLTLARLRNTDFDALFNKILISDNVSSPEYKKLLSLATIFINEPSPDLIRLGYRIIVFYCNQTKDYKPLYDVALNTGLTPIVKSIERITKYNEFYGNSFFKEYYSSFMEIYKEGGNYLSEQQYDLFKFFDESGNKTVSVVAPTSYGKSELIIFALKKREKGNVCIIVPTKALLAQTKRRIIEARIDNIFKIITHPEMYIDGEINITAVLTQERLLRLLKKSNNLSFDIVFVDEAHNLLENDDRNLLLATSLTILVKRNKDVIFKFLTPFLGDSSNLCVSYTNYVPEPYFVDEYIKTERFFLYDFRNDKKLITYDQFTNGYPNASIDNYTDDIDLIIKNKSSKNIIYLNKPSDIESFSSKFTKILPSRSTENIEKACGELSKHLHSEYSLIDCIKKGFIYHHGSVPDNVRIYIEHLYRTESEMRFVVTSSTLLEGVNLPAVKLFLLDIRKGRGHLTPSQFKNLIGRICRFSDIFSNSDEDLKKLEPEIYLIGSEYIAGKANLQSFISRCMKVDKKYKDKPKNVLLKEVPINDKNRHDRAIADEFIENYEPGIVSNYNNRYAQYEIGKICFSNNVIEIAVIENEQSMQRFVDSFKSSDIKINTSEELFKLFAEIFLPFIKEGNKYNNLSRLRHSEARLFYQMLLDWRINNASYPEMIASFIRYWGKLETDGRDTIVYVGRWGDKQRKGFRYLWTDIKDKNNYQRINLAIVRIKDEQDFLDNILIKFIEVFNDLGFLENDFYNKIKYSTSDQSKIILIKNGFSIGLSNLIVNSYSEYVNINIDLNTVTLKPEIIDQMKNNNENDILIFETRYVSRFKS